MLSEAKSQAVERNRVRFQRRPESGHREDQSQGPLRARIRPCVAKCHTVVRQRVKQLRGSDSGHSEVQSQAFLRTRVKL